MVKAVNVYLERKKTRQYTGRLTKQKNKFVFEYDKNYRHSSYPIALGPDLPLKKKKHTSSELFPSFEDRIPSKKNPAYPEYCKSTGISPTEKDPLVLLSTIGKRGPSSFIFTPVFEKKDFSIEDLKKFRKELKLSIRDFATIFDVSSASIYRIENNKTSGKNVLKRIAEYYKHPQTALEKIKQTGFQINENKKQFVEDFLKSKTVKNKDKTKFS